MARKRTDFGHAVNAEIEARTARGESAETIAAALGMPAQLSTIRRRQAELRGKAPPHSAQRAGEPAPPSVAPSPPTPAGTGGEDVPDEVPEGTPIEQIDRWLKVLKQGANLAEEHKNLKDLASIAAKVATLMALRHRVAPLPKLDPSDNPDFKALAAQGRERLAKLALELFQPQNAAE
jgi:hypothetical protein